MLTCYYSDYPAIRAAQSKVTVEEGQRATLEVYVSSPIGDELTITWTKSGREVSENFLFDSKHRLTFSSAQISNAGLYNITTSAVYPGDTSNFLSIHHVNITLEVFGELIRIL